MWQRYRERLRKNSNGSKFFPKKKVLTLSIDCCSCIEFFSPEKQYTAIIYCQLNTAIYE
jgi:hypothetical protein